MIRLSVVQFSPQFGDVEANLERIAGFLAEVDEGIVVVPELCTTGYAFENRDEAAAYAEEVPDGRSCQVLKGLARERGLFIVAGFVERDGERLYNTSVLVSPDGETALYRKVHLFLEEKHWFDPGPSGFAVHRVGDAKVGMLICFDWIYPEAFRVLALQGAELICHPANLILPYCQDAMVTRAIENRIFVATVNRTGTEERGGRRYAFTGRSQVVTPRGEILFRLGAAEERTESVEVDLDEALDKHVTELNHLLRDRRPELYRELTAEKRTVEKDDV